MTINDFASPGPLGRPLGGLLGRLGALLGHLGAILGILERSLGVTGPCWIVSATSWGPLGPKKYRDKTRQAPGEPRQAPEDWA
eukprot:5793572-Pyramimonas_sp.AAC.1